MPKLTDAERIERLERAVHALTIAVQNGPGAAATRHAVLHEIADEVEARAS
ncbi:MAG TPA: hypothetical protein VMU64_07025 [Acidimicrobiales bacterium]|nr:hypothetical protein [Acidimicrobiales bacterium]